VITLPRWAVGPTPLTVSDLRALTRAVAREVLAGRYEAHAEPDRRWYSLLRQDPYADVWLIGWSRDQGTELHDHAGSLGALTVVSGTLTERRWVPGPPSGLRTRTLPAGGGAGFPVGHVHDVVNLDDTPAISVHAYSPPLTAMHYYEVDPAGALRRTRTELTGQPEPGAVPVAQPTREVLA
jgi:hypothetical protein